MAREIVTKLWKSFMSELWGFFALSGLLAIHTGIILTVYAIKEVTSHNNIVQALGIVLIILGMVGVMFSWFFHRQQREKRPLCPWGRYVCPCCRSCKSLTSSDDDRSTRGSVRKHRESQPASVFSTPEFRHLSLRYAAFLKQATVGVESRPEEIHESARLHKFSSDATGSIAASSLTNTPQGSPAVTYGRSFICVNSGNESEDVQTGGCKDIDGSQAFVHI